MTREYKTIRECAELWVNGFDEIDIGMIDKLMMLEPDDWEEVTLPSLSDRVYVYDMPADVETDERYGDIVGIETDEGELSHAIYDIRLDDGTHVSVNSGCFDVEREDEILCAWQFSDAIDKHWIAEQDGIEVLSRCGFRVLRSGQFGYFFCIDGSGYDYYKAHWIPLYKASGREWHDPEADPAEYMVNEGRNQTLTGNYHFEFEEIENRFGIVVDDDMKENIGDYVARNYGHVVAELDMSEDFDFTFYTSYCPNCES